MYRGGGRRAYTEELKEEDTDRERPFLGSLFFFSSFLKSMVDEIVEKIKEIRKDSLPTSRIT